MVKAPVIIVNGHGTHEIHEKIKALTEIFLCSFVDSVANIISFYQISPVPAKADYLH
jgi:hypothetical protein